MRGVNRLICFCEFSVREIAVRRGADDRAQLSFFLTLTHLSSFGLARILGEFSLCFH